MAAEAQFEKGEYEKLQLLKTIALPVVDLYTLTITFILTPTNTTSLLPHLLLLLQISIQPHIP